MKLKSKQEISLTNGMNEWNSGSNLLVLVDVDGGELVFQPGVLAEAAA